MGDEAGTPFHTWLAAGRAAVRERTSRGTSVFRPILSFPGWLLTPIVQPAPSHSTCPGPDVRLQ